MLWYEVAIFLFVIAMLLLFLFLVKDLPIRLLPPFHLDIGQSVAHEGLVYLAKTTTTTTTRGIHLIP